MKNTKNYVTVRTKLDDPKLTFRVPEKLRNELLICARRMGRTLNAEIMIRLIQSLDLHELITEVPFKSEEIF